MQRTALVVSAFVALAACSSGGGDSQDTASPTSFEAATTEPAAPAPSAVESTVAPTTEPATSAPPTTDAPELVTVGEWQSIPAEDCVCSDGSPFELWERPADPTKVVLYFEGGGACFSAETCGPASPIYTHSLTLGEEPGASGIFDPTNPENPLAEHSIVYVPYCTGDVHLGDRVNDYSDTVTINHNGFDNASKGLETVIADYPDVEQLVVAGSSAGSIPAPAFAGLAADGLPDTEIIVFGDASGAYPDVPALNASVGAEWGVLENVPDWPGTAELTPEQWSFPGLYVQSGLQHPDITFARFDNAFDGVQAFFSGVLGIDASDLLSLIDATEAEIEAAGVPVASYIAPGDSHTILGNDAFYELEVEGVRLVDFLTTLVDGEVPADVRCVDCR